MCVPFFLKTLLYLHFIPAENVKQLYKKILNIQIWEGYRVYRKQLACGFLSDFFSPYHVYLWGGGGMYRYIIHFTQHK